jgi:undecaprenyl-diphosphatase
VQNLETQKHQYIYNYEVERQKNVLAVALLFISLITFLLTLIGFTDGISEIINNTLINSLGYNNKWSKIIGPDWFVQINEDISSLGGSTVIFILLVVISGYYYFKKEQKRLWKLLFVVIGGGIMMQILKMIFADQLPYEPIELFTTTISSYPSGHAMMAMIFYLTIAVYRTRRHGRKKVRIYTIICAVVVIFLIGVSRVLHGSHNLTEVLAGWSAGMIWLSSIWMLERIIKKHTASAV